jgi:hypothetical protein
MPKNALAAPPPGLCYDRVMKEVVSPDVDVVKRPAVRRKPRTKRHIAPPLTAEQISRGVGVTKKDAALVTKVLLKLGYIKGEGKGNGARRKKVKTSKS